MAKAYSGRDYALAQLIFLVLLRVSIGWHLLYEGVVKIINPDWSAFGYLMDSKGLFAGLFQSMATHQGILQVVYEHVGIVFNRSWIDGGIVHAFFSYMWYYPAEFLLSLTSAAGRHSIYNSTGGQLSVGEQDTDRDPGFVCFIGISNRAGCRY